MIQDGVGTRQGDDGNGARIMMRQREFYDEKIIMNDVSWRNKSQKDYSLFGSSTSM
jgi:hypothetical protein